MCPEADKRCDKVPFLCLQRVRVQYRYSNNVCNKMFWIVVDWVIGSSSSSRGFLQALLVDILVTYNGALEQLSMEGEAHVSIVHVCRVWDGEWLR